MEAAKDIVSQEPLPGAKAIDEFESERQPFESPQLSQVDNLNVRTPQTVASKESIYKLAQSVGMLNVVRWKPRLVSNISNWPKDLGPACPNIC